MLSIDQSDNPIEGVVLLNDLIDKEGLSDRGREGHTSRFDHHSIELDRGVGMGVGVGVRVGTGTDSGVKVVGEDEGVVVLARLRLSESASG